MIVPIGWFSSMLLLLRVRPYGASFLSATYTVKVSSSDNPPGSVALTLILYNVFVSKSNTVELLKIPDVVKLNELLSVYVIESINSHVCGPPSGSTTVNVPIVVPVAVPSVCINNDT